LRHLRTERHADSDFRCVAGRRRTR
jgi:hypothetical protein